MSSCGIKSKCSVPLPIPDSDHMIEWNSALKLTSKIQFFNWLNFNILFKIKIEKRTFCFCKFAKKRSAWVFFMVENNLNSRSKVKSNSYWLCVPKANTVRVTQYSCVWEIYGVTLVDFTCRNFKFNTKIWRILLIKSSD